MPPRHPAWTLWSTSSEKCLADSSMTLLHGIIGCLCCLSHISSMVEGGLRVHPPRRGKRLSTHCDGANPPELPGRFLASKACASAIWTSISPGAWVDWTILVMMFSVRPVWYGASVAMLLTWTFSFSSSAWKTPRLCVPQSMRRVLGQPA